MIKARVLTINTAVHKSAHSFQVLDANTSSLYLGKVPLTTISHMQVKNILARKKRPI